jgi:hypothetical protein
MKMPSLRLSAIWAPPKHNAPPVRMPRPLPRSLDRFRPHLVSTKLGLSGDPSVELHSHLGGSCQPRTKGGRLSRSLGHSWGQASSPTLVSQGLPYTALVTFGLHVNACGHILQPSNLSG